MRSKPEQPDLPEVVARLRAVLGEGGGVGSGRRGLQVEADAVADPDDEAGPIGAASEPDGRSSDEGGARTPAADSLVATLRRAASESGPGRTREWPSPARIRGLLPGGSGSVSPVARWRLSSPAARGLTLLLVASLAASAWLVVHSLPRRAAPVVVPAVTTSTTAAGGSLAAPTASPALLVVDVAGPVVHPGIVRVPDGSRVVDVIRAAGGLRKGASAGALNLARKVVDGEQVVVGAASPATTSSGNSTSGGLLDLNSATVDELDALPHVGPVLAQRIVDWRDAHGRFSTVDELREVSGIGSRIFAEVSARVRV